MTIAASIDEQTVVHLLDISAKQGLDVLLRIVGYLLELVDGEDAGFVGLLQITENLFQRQFWGVDVAQFDVESGRIGNGVVAETASQRVKPCQEFVQDGLSLGHQYRVDFLTQKQYQLV